MTIAELTYKDYTGSIEVSVEDDCLHGRIQFIDDLVTYEGDSVPSIKIAFQEATDRYIAYCAKTGKPANKPYSGTFNVRLGPDLHKQVAQAAYKANSNLNQFMIKAAQDAVNNNGQAKIEHTHNHIVTIKQEDTKTAIMAQPTKWGGMYAANTAH